MSVKQLGSQMKPGSNLFAKVINGLQILSLAGKELNKLGSDQKVLDKHSHKVLLGLTNF